MELLADEASSVTAHLRALEWLAPEEKVLDLSPAGEGNMNRTLRLTTDQRSLILKQSVPFVAKYPDIPAPVERIHVEHAFYAAIAGHPYLAERTPQVLGYDPSAHLVAFSDLGEGSDFSDEYGQQSNVALDQRADLQLAVDWLSQLHTVDVANKAAFANQAMRELNHAHIFVIPLQPDNGLELGPELKAYAEQLTANQELVQAANALGEVYLDTHPKGVLLHGDYYPGSWLHHAELTLAVIDPEFAFVGPREFDLGVFKAHLVFCGYAPDDVDRMFERYEHPIDHGLMDRFAAIEHIRRLLGVAQLPLTATVQQKLNLLDAAAETLTS